LDKSTIIGFIGGFSLVIIAITSQGDIALFIDPASFLIVGGGVASTSMINYGLEDIKNSFIILKYALTTRQTDLRTDIEIMNMFSKKARREGMLKLENDVEHVNDAYLKNGLQLAIDGVSKESLESILNDQVLNLKSRYEKSVSLLYAMADYSPAFGMIGTVIGLILMLQNIADPEQLGKGLSVALLTTLYGTIFANMIFGPLAGKLKHISDIELSRMYMLKAGIMSMVNEENPRIMEKKMLSYVPPEQRAEFVRFYDEHKSGKKREDKIYENWIEIQEKPWQNLQIILETG